ncbi:RWD domain-containing protein 1 [Arachis ipaensis]|uniref:RWD domain-containing protein 1 n=1 Tax=Arachis ipaensis TaxID=130454 RepID=UPI000A2B0CCA|nr:RWD domain-containing protein 1 [Arachis ipaensis]
MTDYTQEQEMEIEALEAILMDEFKEIHSGESGLSTSNRCFQITVSAQDDDTDGSFNNPAQLALIFSHTEKYPDEPPLLNVKSLQGINTEDLKNLKEKLIQEASENLGMAMIYTLVTSAKEWLAEKFQDTEAAEAEAEEAAKDDVVVPHGEPVTLETFLAWRERFEAELALERAKILPVIFFPLQKGAAAVNEESEEEDEEDIDFDDDDFEVDEEDMLEHYLAEKSDSSTHSSKRAS